MDPLLKLLYILLSIVAAIAQQSHKIVPQCLLRCKDEHMMQVTANLVMNLHKFNEFTDG
jgi:hypothetical protein